MRAALAVALLAMGALLSGCIVPSLHPFFPEKDRAQESGLVGSWSRLPDKDDSTDARAGQVWKFTQIEEDAKGYDLAISEKGQTANFEAHLAKLGDTLFLDMTPGDSDPCGSKGSSGVGDSSEEEPAEPLSLWWIHMLPAHSVWRVRLEGDGLKLDALDTDWVEKQVQADTLGLRSEKASDARVLTASPEELREFLLKHAKDSEAFPDCFSLKRQPEPPAPPAEGEAEPEA